MSGESQKAAQTISSGWLPTCLGYAGRYLQRPSRLLTYLNNAVYPLFCLHLTVIVALDYAIVPLGWSVLVKYLAITTGTFIVTLGSYELLWRRVAWLRPLVGLKPVSGRSANTLRQAYETAHKPVPDIVPRKGFVGAASSRD